MYRNKSFKIVNNINDGFKIMLFYCMKENGMELKNKNFKIIFIIR